MDKGKGRRRHGQGNGTKGSRCDPNNQGGRGTTIGQASKRRGREMKSRMHDEGYKEKFLGVPRVGSAHEVASTFMRSSPTRGGQPGRTGRKLRQQSHVRPRGIAHFTSTPRTFSSHPTQQIHHLNDRPSPPPPPPPVCVSFSVCMRACACGHVHVHARLRGRSVFSALSRFRQFMSRAA